MSDLCDVCLEELVDFWSLDVSESESGDEHPFYVDLSEILHLDTPMLELMEETETTSDIESQDEDFNVPAIKKETSPQDLDKAAENSPRLIRDSKEENQELVERKRSAMARRTRNTGNKSQQRQLFQFQCPTCFKILGSKQGFTYHTEAVHEKKTKFKCEHCSKAFYGKQQLQMHIARHHNSSFKCKHCSKAFKTKSKLEQHQTGNSRFDFFEVPTKFKLHFAFFIIFRRLSLHLLLRRVFEKRKKS